MRILEVVGKCITYYRSADEVLSAMICNSSEALSMRNDCFCVAVIRNTGSLIGYGALLEVCERSYPNAEFLFANNFEELWGIEEAVFKFVHDTDVKELYVKFSHPSFPIDQNLCTKILKARQTKIYSSLQELIFYAL
ncbi:unnamed protein product [Enterobius vermicularis]|uniref:N-acetyltransferase domain-containing protein n=1 Tax=Enterobius vermicularis TaxID=51028 RepID=A0A0N4V5X7_ENTVE|nr:unnamed protein product [Enterobius vermicularis]